MQEEQAKYETLRVSAKDVENQLGEFQQLGFATPDGLREALKSVATYKDGLVNIGMSYKHTKNLYDEARYHIEELTSLKKDFLGDQAQGISGQR